MKPPVEAPRSAHVLPRGSIGKTSSAFSSLSAPRETYRWGAASSLSRIGAAGSTSAPGLSTRGLADDDRARHDERLRLRPRLGEAALDEEHVDALPSDGHACPERRRGGQAAPRFARSPTSSRHAPRDPAGVEAELGALLRLIAVRDELVRDAEPAHDDPVRDEPAPLERLEARGAEAAREAALLDRDDAARRARASADDQLLVERLREPGVDDRRGERRPRRARPRRRGPRGASSRGPRRRRPACPARRARCAPSRSRARFGAESSGDALARCRAGSGTRSGPSWCEGGVEHVPQLVLVGRRHHDEVRDAAQVREVERALVRLAVGADQPAAVERERDRAGAGARRRG